LPRFGAWGKRPEMGWHLEPGSPSGMVFTNASPRIPLGARLRENGILQKNKMKKVAFHSQTLGFRGSEQALWDYAELNESILGNQSLICFRALSGMQQTPAFVKWKSRFPLLPYHDFSDLKRKLVLAGAEIFYMLKPGPFNRDLVPGIKNCVHAMFLTDEFHGDCFAYVSRWCSEVMTGQPLSFVPHLVTIHPPAENLRSELGIPRSARVFGRHGATDTFNIQFVSKAVLDHARRYPGDHFIFLNTDRLKAAYSPANIHYLPGTNSPEKKAAFLATCDAMLHARWHGETFGLAVGEFAVLGKPVITFGGSRERAHLDALGSQACIYQNAEELRLLLREFEPRQTGETLYSHYAQPHRVMKMFREVFLGDAPSEAN